jgi:hypothetical protein
LNILYQISNNLERCFNEDDSNSFSGTGVASTARPGASAAGAKKKGEDIDPSPPYVVNNLKNARFKVTNGFKLDIWIEFSYH